VERHSKSNGRNCGSARGERQCLISENDVM
jgi:hypothetical protein